MKYRKLRIAFSAVCGIICLLLIALWVRSYQQCEFMSQVRSGNRITVFGSNWGTAYLVQRKSVKQYWPPLSLDWSYATADAEKPGEDLQLRLVAGDTLIRVPYMQPVAMVAAIGGAPWIRWRFSLRTLLIGMTLVAVVLGAIVYAT
jgi:hypothetical protein